METAVIIENNKYNIKYMSDEEVMKYIVDISNNKD